ncbi:MAG: outer membrane protein assembly factor BamB family protein [Planctomycetaceae bacterium]
MKLAALENRLRQAAFVRAKAGQLIRSGAVVSLAAMLLTCIAQECRAQRNQAAPAGEAFFLDTDAAAAKKLAAARDLLAARQWDDGIDLVRQAALQHAGKLVATAPGRYVDVQTYCDSALAQLPPEGLANYRRRTDPQARRWFEAARAVRDEAGLRKIVHRALLSSYGDDALFLLGELAFEQGELSRARRYWEKLLPLEVPVEAGALPQMVRYPDSDIDPAGIRARLVLCRLLQGEPARAEQELADFRRMHPNASGRLAGRKGNLPELLVATVESMRQAPAKADHDPLTTFAGNVRRNSVRPRGVDVGSVLWSSDLAEYKVERPSRFDEPLLDLPQFARRDRLPAIPSQPALAFFPVVYDNLVWYCDETTICARELLSEKPGRGAWGGNSVVYKMPTDDERPLVPARRRAGTPHFTLSIDNNLVYAQMGPAATRGRNSNALVCLDIARQGDLLWMVHADKLNLDGGGWIFDGTPLAAHGRVFVTLRRHEPQLQLNVACLDGRTGQPVWNRKIAVGIENFGGELDEFHHQLLTLAEEQLFFCTNMGVVASFSADDGAIRWITAYPRSPIDSVVELNKRMTLGPNPCMFHDGLVFAAPIDSDRVLAFDAESGRREWEREIKRNAHQLLGVADGRLIVAGDWLWALETATGKTAWEVGDHAPETATCGRGALAGGLVYWPQREEIQMIEIATGRIRRKVSLSAQHSLTGGGNLAIANDMLVMAQPGRLVAFSEYGALRRQRDEELSLKPDDARGWFELGLLEAAVGRTDAALTALRRAHERLSNDSSDSLLKDGVTGYLARILRNEAGRLKANARPLDALAPLEEASRVAKAPQRVEIAQELAALHEQQQNVRGAVLAWQSLLDDAPQVGPDIGASQPGSAVQKAVIEIDRLIERAGRDVYQPVEDLAAQELALAKNAGDKVTALFARYPHSAAAREAAASLARQQREVEDFSASDRTWKWLLDNRRGDRSAQITALTGLAINAESRSRLRSAAGFWQQLYDAAPDATITLSGLRGVVRDLIPARLGRHDAGRDEPRRSDAFEPVVRIWERSLAAGKTCVIPEEHAPTGSSPAVLVSDSHLSLIDGPTGQTRWQVPLAEPVHWAAYAANLLILATTTGACGVEPDDGRLVWQTPLEQVGQPDSARRPRFCIHGDRLFGLSGHSGAFELYPENGVFAWSYRPPRGDLQPRWRCDADRIALQTLRPDRIHVLDVRSRALAIDAALPGGPWTQDPVALPALTLWGLPTFAGPPQIFDAALGRRVAFYRGPLSSSRVNASLFADATASFAAIDGTTLARFDPRSGVPQWSRRLGPLPAPHLENAESVCLDRQRLYCVSGGVLRCLAVEGARLLWERHVGPPDESWCVIRTPRALVIWARSSNRTVSIALCDPTDGELLERLNLPGPSNQVAVHALESLLIVATDTQVCALAPLAPEAP